VLVVWSKLEQPSGKGAKWNSLQKQVIFVRILIAASMGSVRMQSKRTYKSMAKPSEVYSVIDVVSVNALCIVF